MSDFSKYLEQARQKLVDTGARSKLIHIGKDSRGGLSALNSDTDILWESLVVKKKSLALTSSVGESDKAVEEDTDLFSASDMFWEDALPAASGKSDEDTFAGEKDRQTEEQDDDTAEDITPLSVENEEECIPDPTKELLFKVPSETLEKDIRRFAFDARSAEEEQGVGILFLALGTLTWYESENSDVERRSPLILIPVELIRNEKSLSYRLMSRPDDIGVNQALYNRLSGDFGIDLPDIEEDKFVPSVYFESVKGLLKKDWTLDTQSTWLGFLSFAKISMVKDLDPSVWDGRLETHPLLSGLVSEGFEEMEDPLPQEGLDEWLSPFDILQVVDADASQTRVIETVSRGGNLVIEGPPGTGKSQTITNILAQAIYQGKKVLFIAEKKAALDVVLSRMKSSGLGEMCLELHGRAANRRQVLEDIGLSLSLALDDVPVHEEPKELLLIRDALNGLSKSIHTPLSNAETPFRILSHMSGLRAQSYLAHGLDDKKLSSLSFQEIEDVIEQATGVLEKVKTVGDVYTHPLSFMKVKSRDPYERANMVKQCDIFLSHVEDLRLSWEQAFGTPFVLSESSPDRLDRLVGTLKSRPDEWSKLHSVVATLEGSQEGLSTLSSLSVFLSSKLKASRIWDLEALSDLPLDSWISIVEDASVSLWKRLVGPYRGIKSKLSSASNVPLPDDFDKLVSWMKDGAAYKSSLEKLEPHLLYLNDTVPFWKEDLEDLFEVRSWERKVSSLVPKGMSLSLAFDVSNVSKVERVLEFWTKSQKSSVSAKESWDFSDKAHSVSLSELEVLMSSALEAFEDYSDWSLVMVFLSELDRIGAGSLKASVLAGGSIEEVEGRLIAAWSEGNWRRACEERPDLKDLGSVNRHDLVEGFARRDIDLMKNNKMKIRAVHRGQLPRGAHGEMGILRGEISKKSRHMPLRKLMSVAGTTIQRIKPVFFMSPLSVAQHLSPGDLDFDLLVIDEASQVRPEDALGAIARARQIVVVGDQKQLPPTSFFDKILEEEASSDGLANVTDMESILSLCRARGVSERMLEWHYRSKDPSLMTVSNTEFYREKLILPPAPFKDKDSTGLVLTPVEGLYARKGSHTGRPGTNSIEALAVIDSLEDLHRKHPERSLGVVALSRTQADCILETLEVQARHRPLLASLLRQTGPEALFVKNLETVQGDERDIILISVGYGPVKEGGRLASMNFGPINQEGGERRLNVLFTRSRYRCEVFCSFDPEDIDLKKSETFGVRVLKRFLMFAKEGQLDQRLLTGMGPDSPFEESVADAIHSLGYGVDFQVGSAGFRVDLAVYEHSRPSRYILAVECDGAAYHSAQWARERDRLRQGILEGMGWTFHRVWSTDWFHNKAYEIRRLKSALEKAVKNEKVAPALVAPLVVEDEETSIDPNILRQKVASLSSKPLKEYQVWPCEDVGDDYRGWVSVLRGVIDVEGPVHSDALLKRVQEATNRNRATAKWKESVLSALSELSDEYLSKSDFWMTAEQFTQGPRHRPEFLRFDPVPDFEIKAVCDLLEKESDFSEESEKILVVSKALGVVKSSVSGYFE